MLVIGIVVLFAVALVLLMVGTVLLPVLLPIAVVSVLAGQPYQTTPPGLVPPIAIPVPSIPTVNDGSSLMSTIQPWIGSRYVFGGNGPPANGVDCSAFTLSVIRQVYGVTLPRTAQGQYDATQRPAPAPEPGDLVFFSRTYASPDYVTHVGIYVGGGMMVSAIEPTLGQQVLNSPYWLAHLVGFGRVRR